MTPGSTLLAVDFDGTLAPIRERLPPAGVTVVASFRELFRPIREEGMI